MSSSLRADVCPAGGGGGGGGFADSFHSDSYIILFDFNLTASSVCL